MKTVDVAAVLLNYQTALSGMGMPADDLRQARFAIGELFEACAEVAALCEKKRNRALRFQQLAAQARTVEQGSPEHRNIQAEAGRLSTEVVDFSTALDKLQAALARCSPKIAGELTC